LRLGGYEPVDRTALLESMVVDSQFRELYLGSSLIKQILGQLRLLEVEAVYILTETADQYFLQFDFKALGYDKLPLEIKSTKQCQTFCPASAKAMRL